MNLEAEKWYNGMESFMRQVKWPPYIASSHLKNLAQVMFCHCSMTRLLRITNLSTCGFL